MKWQRPMPGRPAAPANNRADADLWFLGYDIADPKRLGRVHRCVRREGLALQYSGFAVAGDHRDLQSLLDQLACIIDSKADDVRAYHLPARCQVWSLGSQAWPDGLVLAGHDALLQLLMTGSRSADVADGHAMDNAGTMPDDVQPHRAAGHREP